MTDKLVPWPGFIPNGYNEVLYSKITEKPMRVIVMQILSILLFVFFSMLFFNLVNRLGNYPTSFEFGPVEIIIVITAILMTLVLHELVHGLMMKLHGAKPQYGVMWKQLMFYATSPGFAYPRNRFIQIALAPFLLLTLMFVLGIFGLKGTPWVLLLALCASLNASGAIGDVWMSILLLRFGPEAFVVDEKDGVRVFIPVD